MGEAPGAALPLTVYGANQSFFTRKVTGYLDYKGVQWHLRRGLAPSEEARAADWPDGIPAVLGADGEVMWDSHSHPRSRPPAATGRQPSLPGRSLTRRPSVPHPHPTPIEDHPMTDTRNPPYGTIDADYATRLATTPPEEDGPVWMLNLMSYHETAQYADGRDDQISGQEADDRYSPTDVLADLGAEPVFFADVDTQLLGDSPSWDRVAVVKYPTRRSFIDMQARPDFQAKYVHKEAGMAQTIIAGCQPMASPADDLDPATLPDWADVAHPPTDDDGPVVVLHLIRFHPGEAEGEMLSYQRAAGETAVPHGVRISGWFGVEGTIVGDGRQWDQARFNAFPSRAAFMAVVADPARLEAQKDHRETAIADTYTMILRPLVDRLAESTADHPTTPTTESS